MQPAGAGATSRRALIRVLGPVSAGHFLSHFYWLLLPPLFPVLRDVYGVGYTELGLAITVFSVFSVVTEAPIGFLVDRYGARRILLTGIVVQSFAVAAIGLFPHYPALLVLLAVSGVANAVYHPADYSILNASVPGSFMGRAFSIHTAMGFLGNAVAPFTVIGLMAIAGWQMALVICGAGGLAVALVIGLNAAALKTSGTDATPGDSPRGTRSGIGLLLSFPVIMGLLFYAGIAMAGQGVYGFSVSSLHLIYAAPIAEVAVALSAFLFASPVGVLLGGYLADRTTRHELNVAVSFCVSAVAVFAVAAFVLPIGAVAALLAVAGLCVGVVAPSRDMLIRSITPPGDVGKVFGFVSSGFNVGGIAAPVAYGYLLDTGEPRVVFWVTGALWLATMGIVLVTGWAGRRSRLASLAR